MADDDGETPRMSTDAFSRLKVADMKAVLKELHDSKQHGKVKRSGKKNDLINEFRRVHGEEVEPSEPEDEEDAEPSAEKLRKIAQAEAIMASLIIPSDRTISKSTKQVMRDMRYASTKYGLREDDLSDNLEQLYAFCYTIDSITSSLDVVHDHSANHDNLGEALRDAYHDVRLEDARFAEFFLAHGLDLKAPDDDMQMGMQAATAGQEHDTAIKEEMEMLSLVVQHRLYTWTETFPLPEGDDAIFPQDFLESERVALRKFVTKSLDCFQEEDEEVDLWTREMDDAQLDTLVGRLEALPYPLDISKGHNRTVLKAVVRDVKGHRERSLSRSRSRSKSVAASERSLSPVKGSRKASQKASQKVAEDKDSEEDEEEVVAESSKRAGKKRARVSEGDGDGDGNEDADGGGSRGSRRIVRGRRIRRGD